MLVCAAAVLVPLAARAQAPTPTPSPGAESTPAPARTVLRAAAVNAPATASPANPTGRPAVSPAPAIRPASAVKPALAVPPAPAPPVAAAAGPANPLALLAPEDVVSVKVYQEDDLLTTARISKEGIINFPLIGSVSIAGKTPEDAARVIAAQLAKDYLVNPQVTITVTEYSLRHFTVLGEVQKPGDYTMPDRNSVTLLEAIGDAGGYTRIADPANIRVKRLESGGKESVIKLNAKSMASERQTVSFEVKPGDIITVGQSFF
jgi:protein involved in polysaccharide export with SLBB domain